MRQKGFSPIIILLVLAIVALMGLAYLAGTKGLITNNASPVSSIAPSPISSVNPTYSYGTFSFSYPNTWKLTENTTDPNFFSQNKLSGFDHEILLQDDNYYLLIGIDNKQTGAEVGGIFTSDADYQDYLSKNDQITIQGEKFFLQKSHISLVDVNSPNTEAGIYGLASLSKYVPDKVLNNNQGKSFNGYDNYFHENGKSYMFIKLSKTGSGAILTPAEIQTGLQSILESIKW